MVNIDLISIGPWESVLTTEYKYPIFGNSLAVQWLGLSAFTAMAWVQSLVGELKIPSAARCGRKKRNPIFVFLGMVLPQIK